MRNDLARFTLRDPRSTILHDFLLAKEIISELERIISERNLKKVKKVYIEIGNVSLAHDDYPEHTEDISVENLQFGLKNISKGGIFKDTEFFVRKTSDGHWKITDIEV